MTKKERYRKFLEYIAANKPSVNTELKYYNPYQLIVSVILSAQCTDKRVNLITPEFFKKFPTVHNLAGATVNEIYELIKSCSYPNNKAKHLLGMAHALTERYDRAIPSDIAELQKIPGIGRKSANVLASVLFNKPVIAVDTHVYRVSARIGLTLNAVTPVHTEKQLVQHIPEAYRSTVHNWLVLHGRYVCKARHPECGECQIKKICKEFSRD